MGSEDITVLANWDDVAVVSVWNVFYKTLSEHSRFLHSPLSQSNMQCYESVFMAIAEGALWAVFISSNNGKHHGC